MGYLGNPQDLIPAIHVGGTNGKGSVSASISSILASAGAKVGLTISPHLIRANERVVVDGLPIGDDMLASQALKVRNACRELGIKASMHEGLTAIAFLSFLECGVDLMVVEVGLGGRLDSSNILKKPVVSVITGIDYDHENILGDTLALIARQKAGIVKPGVPLVTGEMPAEALAEISEAAAQKASQHIVFNSDFGCSTDVPRGGACNGTGYYWERGSSEQLEYRPTLRGEHQIRNMAVAIRAARVAGASLEHCKRGVESVFWPARLERAEVRGRSVFIDAAHNPQGVRGAVDFIRSNNFSSIEIGFGVIKGKRWQEMIELLRPFVSKWRLLAPRAEKAVPTSEVAAYLSGIGISSIEYGDDYERFVNDALDENSPSNEVPLFILGSLYMVGYVREHLGLGEYRLWPDNRVERPLEILHGSSASY